MKNSKILTVLLTAALLSGCAGNQTAPAETTPESTTTTTAVETTQSETAQTTTAETTANVTEANTTSAELDGVWYLAPEDTVTEEASSDTPVLQERATDRREPTIKIDYEPDGEVEDMDFTFDDDGDKYEGKYTGKVKNNIPEGSGYFESEGTDYHVFISANWKDGQLAGIGYFELENDAYKVIVDGEFKGSEYFGETRVETFDKKGFTVEKYYGDIVNGAYSGNGVLENYILRYDEYAEDNLYYDKILTYKGAFSDGHFNGEGWLYISVEDNGERIESVSVGTFKNDHLWNGTITNSSMNIDDLTSKEAETCTVTNGVQGEFHEMGDNADGSEENLES